MITVTSTSGKRSIQFENYPSIEEIFEKLSRNLAIGTQCRFASADGELMFSVRVDPSWMETAGLNVFIERNRYIFRLITEPMLNEYIEAFKNGVVYPHYEYGDILIIKSPQSRGFENGRPIGDGWQYDRILEEFFADSSGCPKLLFGRSQWCDQASGFEIWCDQG